MRRTSTTSASVATLDADRPVAIEPTDRPGLSFFLVRPGRSGLSSVWDALLAASFAGIMLYPTLLLRVLKQLPTLSGALTGSVLPLTVMIVMLIWATAVRDSAASNRALVVSVGVLYVVTALVGGKLLSIELGVSRVTTLEQSILLLPVAAVTGFAVARGGRLRQYMSWLLLFAVPTVAAAVVERYAGVSLIHQNHSAFVQGGVTRAVVGTEHPLVLGALLVALIPIAQWLVRGVWAYVLIAALYFGVWTTGSSGPLVVGAVIVAVCVVPPVARVMLAKWWGWTTVLGAVAAYIVIGAQFLWSDQIRLVDENDVSNEYRAALYHLLPRILADAPFGYGIGGAPVGRWRIYTINAGARDITQSIDSELVYAITQYGLIALLIYIAIAYVGVRTGLRHHAVGLCSLSTTLIGLFLAIHSWGSLGTFWFFVVGAGIAICTARDDSLDWRGLYRPATHDPGPGAPTADARNRIQERLVS